jgi:hypothetical protein
MQYIQFELVRTLSPDNIRGIIVANGPEFVLIGISPAQTLLPTSSIESRERYPAVDSSQWALCRS